MKVFLLGIDGMTFSILHPYMQAGTMPHFQKMIREGAAGVLRSTIPFVTGPGWTSMSTGKNPDKHGLFNFTKRQGYDTSITTKASHHDAEPVWNILGRHDKRLIIANVPFTFPPDAVNGIMISGFMTPSEDTDFVYPPSRKQEIFRLAPSYRIDVDSGRHILVGDKEALLREVVQMTEDSGTVIRHLMETDPWDLFFSVFVGSDRLQHAYWDEVMSMDPSCVAYYQLLDRILGEILGALDEDTVLMVVSDHGFGYAQKSFYINTFFERAGFLKLRGGKSEGKRTTGSPPAGRLLMNTANRLGLMRLKDHIPAFVRNRLKRLLPDSGFSSKNIDWASTKAFSILGYGMVSLNLEGREPEGCVSEQEYDRVCQEISEALLAHIDPDTGDPVVETVHKGRELYSPPEGVDVPDLVVEMKEGYAIKEEMAGHVLSDHMLGNLRIYGDHRREGVVIAWGKPILKGEVSADIVDIMPTVLHLLGVPVPEDLDGRVLETIIDKAFLEANPIRFSEGRGGGPKQREELSKEEEEKLAEHLKNLGYLD